MNAYRSQKIREYPFLSGERNLVCLAPMQGGDHPWAYTLFVQVVGDGVLRGSILGTSLLADHILLQDRLEIVCFSGSQIWEGEVRVETIDQGTAGRLTLDMRICSLDLRQTAEQGVVPRT